MMGWRLRKEKNGFYTWICVVHIVGKAKHWGLKNEKMTFIDEDEKFQEEIDKGIQVIEIQESLWFVKRITLSKLLAREGMKAF